MPEGKYKVLITGGLGKVGSIIRDDRLGKKRYQITVLDIKHDKDRFDVTGGDEPRPDLVRNEDTPGSFKALDDRLKGQDVVIHLAGLPHPGIAGKTERDYWRENHVSTQIILRSMKRVGVKHMIFFSSGGIYGLSNGSIDLKYLPIDERHPKPVMKDLTWYDQTKLACESSLREAETKHNISSVSFRLERPGWETRTNRMTGAHFYAACGTGRLQNLVWEACEYLMAGGKTVVLNAGDTSSNSFQPPTVEAARGWMALNYPGAECRLTRDDEPFFCVDKCEKVLGI